MDRTCSTCRETKPLEDFGRTGRTESQGRHYECKACRNARKRSRPAAVKRAERLAWRQRHPEQRAAHRAIAKALKAGRMVRPDACESCAAEGHVHAHHDDYDRRYDVRWLCQPCHIEVHVQLRREAADAQAA